MNLSHCFNLYHDNKGRDSLYVTLCHTFVTMANKTTLDKQDLDENENRFYEMFRSN